MSVHVKFQEEKSVVKVIKTKYFIYAIDPVLLIKHICIIERVMTKLFKLTYIQHKWGHIQTKYAYKPCQRKLLEPSVMCICIVYVRVSG